MPPLPLQFLLRLNQRARFSANSKIPGKERENRKGREGLQEAEGRSRASDGAVVRLIFVFSRAPLAPLALLAVAFLPDPQRTLVQGS